MRFPYQAYPVQGIGAAHIALVYRPAVPIRVVGPSGDGFAFGLADTGADETMFTDRFIGPLGVVIRPGDHATITTLDGGAVPVRYGTVDLELSRRGVVRRWSARIAFHAGGKAILGHAGFLQYFTATFNGQHQYVTLRPNGSAPSPTMSFP
jgi:hypothetical protein